MAQDGHAGYNGSDGSTTTRMKVTFFEYKIPQIGGEKHE
jgi:hypothetical protein